MKFIKYWNSVKLHLDGEVRPERKGDLPTVTQLVCAKLGLQPGFAYM